MLQQNVTAQLYLEFLLIIQHQVPFISRDRTKNDKVTDVTNSSSREILYTLFFYKNLFYKNVEAEIDPNFKNVLRTFLRLRVD